MSVIVEIKNKNIKLDLLFQFGTQNQIYLSKIYVTSLAIALTIAIVVLSYKKHLLFWTSAFLHTLLVTALQAACGEAREWATGRVITSQTLCVLVSVCIRGRTDVCMSTYMYKEREKFHCL